jgi:hypothetical protein
MNAQEYENKVNKLEYLAFKFSAALYTYRTTLDPFYYFYAMIFDNMIDEVNCELDN